jgi:hypothetical protein
MPAYGAVPRLKCGVDYPPATYTVMICNVRLTEGFQTPAFRTAVRDAGAGV